MKDVQEAGIVLGNDAGAIDGVMAKHDIQRRKLIKEKRGDMI